MINSLPVRSCLLPKPRFVRFYSKPKDVATGSSKHVQPAKGIKKALTKYFFKFISTYESYLERRFPKVYVIYRQFTTGSRGLYNDVVEYIRISGDLSKDKTVRNLSYADLLRYYQTPKDLLRVGPTLLVSTLPFANYVVFPLAVMFPKKLLSPHFWTIEQRFKYQLEDFAERLKYNAPLLSQLNRQITSVHHPLDRSSSGSLISHYEKCKQIFHQLALGSHPTVDEIITVTPMFVDKPFSIEYLPSSHLGYLCMIHGLSSLPRKRSRLSNYADYLRELDLALIREGGPEGLDNESIQKACFTRGLNPYGMTRTAINSWMADWLSISSHLSGKKEVILPS